MTLAIKSLDLFELICDYPYIFYPRRLYMPLPQTIHSVWIHYICHGAPLPKQKKRHTGVAEYL